MNAKLFSIFVLCLLLPSLAFAGTAQASTINRYLVDSNGYYSTLEYKPHDHVILTSSGAFVFFMDYDDDRLYYRYVSLDGTVGNRAQVTTSRVYEFSVASDGQNVVIGYSLAGGVVAYRTGTISGTAITLGSEVQPSISGFSPAFFSSVTCDSGGSWVSWVVYNDSNQQQYFLASKKLGTSYVWMNEVSNAVPAGEVTHVVSRDAIAYIDDDGVYVAWWNGNEFGTGAKVYEVTPSSSLIVAVQSFQRSPSTSDAVLMILKFNYDFYPSYDCTEYVLKQWTGSQWLTHSVSDGGAREMKQAFWIGKPAYSSVGSSTPLELTWYWKDSSWSSESSPYTSRMVSSAANFAYKVSALYDYDNDDIYLVVFAPSAPSNVYLTISTAGGGTTAPYPGTYQYQSGTNATLTALPSAGYVFAKWVINGTTEIFTSTVALALNGNTTALAVFDPAPPPALPESTYEEIFGEGSSGQSQNSPVEPLQGTQQLVGQVVSNAINTLPEPVRLPVAFTLVGLPIILILLLITGGGATAKGARNAQYRRARR